MAGKVLRHSTDEIDTAIKLTHGIDERVTAMEENSSARAYRLSSVGLKGRNFGFSGNLITESED